MADEDDDPSLGDIFDKYSGPTESTETDEAKTADAERTYEERVAYWRGDIPDPLERQYEMLLDRNCQPRIAAGTLRYLAGVLGLEESCTQPEISDQYGFAEHTLRNWADIAWSTLPFDGPRPSSPAEFDQDLSALVAEEEGNTDA